MPIAAYTTVHKAEASAPFLHTSILKGEGFTTYYQRIKTDKKIDLSLEICSPIKSMWYTIYNSIHIENDLRSIVISSGTQQLLDFISDTSTIMLTPGLYAWFCIDLQSGGLAELLQKDPADLQRILWPLNSNNSNLMPPAISSIWDKINDAGR